MQVRVLPGGLRGWSNEYSLGSYPGALCRLGWIPSPATKRCDPRWNRPLIRARTRSSILPVATGNLVPGPHCILVTAGIRRHTRGTMQCDLGGEPAGDGICLTNSNRRVRSPGLLQLSGARARARARVRVRMKFRTAYVVVGQVVGPLGRKPSPLRAACRFDSCRRHPSAHVAQQQRPPP